MKVVTLVFKYIVETETVQLARIDKGVIRRK